MVVVVVVVVYQRRSELPADEDHEDTTDTQFGEGVVVLFGLRIMYCKLIDCTELKMLHKNFDIDYCNTVLN